VVVVVVEEPVEDSTQEWEVWDLTHNKKFAHRMPPDVRRSLADILVAHLEEVAWEE